jgi:hypothetical protein
MRDCRRIITDKQKRFVLFLSFLSVAPDQQPNLSQLASLAGAQNSAPPPSMGQNGPIPGMNMNMNDNSGGDMNNGGMPQF